MGCSNAKQALDDAIHELKNDPEAGLINLRTALAQVGHDLLQQERVKAKVTLIFDLLPKAMEGVSGHSPWPVLAVCGVIVHCVTLCADPSIGGAQVEITGEAIKRCQRCLVALLKKSQNWSEWLSLDARKRWECESSLEWPKSWACDGSAKKVDKAGTLAMIALLMFEAHATEYKQELASPVASGGVATALEAMHPENGGVSMKTKESIALMLSLFADTPKIAEKVIAHGGTFALTSYVAEPKKRDVSKDMHSHCITVLEACLAHSQNVENKDQIQAALNEGALAWETAFSTQSDSRF